MLRKILDSIIKNKRYWSVVLLLLFTFSVNQYMFSRHSITTEDCKQGSCLTNQSIPTLEDKNPFYYVDDVLKNKGAGYYRLTYQTKADIPTVVNVNLTTYSEKELPVSSINIEPSINYQSKEVLLSSSGEYPNIVFEKSNFHDGAKIWIDNVQITKLDINSQEEFHNLKPTIFGTVDTKIEAAKQTEDMNYKFPWLKEPKTALGQVFRADEGYLSGITLAIDITKDENPSSREYVLSLRKVVYQNGTVKPDKEIIAGLKFSMASDLEKYRQADGTFAFPLYAKLEKGADYMISLDNSNVEPNPANYLVLRGSADNDSYNRGTAVMKKGSSYYVIDGDLYFVIHTAHFQENSGQRMLAGSLLEDLGGGKGQYSYATQGKNSDILDIENSKNISFDDGKKIIIGEAGGESFYTYRFNTVYPMKAIHFSAEQPKLGWKKVKAYYSLDSNNWQEIPSLEKVSADSISESQEDLTPIESDSALSDENSSEGASVVDSSEKNDISDNTDNHIQSFDFNQGVTGTNTTVYIKVTYDSNSSEKSKYYGLKNLNFSADLIIR